MSEQDAETPVIDWSQETNFDKVDSPDALHAAARDCQIEMFADLLKDYASAQPVDEHEKPVGTKTGLDFIKDGVKACPFPQEKSAKEAIIASFEHPAAEQEEAPAVVEQEVVQEAVAPAKETTAPANAAADNTIDLSALARDFRAATKRIETLERRVISQAADIETLKSAGQKNTADIKKLTTFAEEQLDKEEARQSVAKEAEARPEAEAPKKFAKIDW